MADTDPRKQSRSALFVFPYAGGGRINFAGWEKVCQPDLFLLEYRGHWSRQKEPFDGSLEEMAEDMMSIILPVSKEYDHFSLFGHSMGALTAWLCTCRLEKQGVHPSRLYVSSSSCPEEASSIQNIDLSDEAALISFARNLQQYPEGFEKNLFVKKNLLPMLQNDLILLQRFMKEHGSSFGFHPRCRADIICLAGKEDPLCRIEGLQKWSDYTDGAFTLKQFPGGHFYFRDEKNLKRLSELLL